MVRLAFALVLLGALVYAEAQKAGQAPPRLPSPIVGKILLPDGRPAAGARIFLISGGDPAVLVSETEAGLDGFFKIGHTLETKLGEPPPIVAFSSEHAGIGFYWLAGWTNGSEIRLKPATELRVSFLAPDGKPAVGLRVAPRFLVEMKPPDPEAGVPPGSAVPETGMRAVLPFPKPLAERFAQTTDAMGEATIPGLPGGAIARLQVLDDRYAELAGFAFQIELARGPVHKAGPFKLALASIVSGRVLDDAGRGVEGVRVGAQGAGEHAGWGSGQTDKEGRYMIAKLAAGEYNVALDLKGKLAEDWTAVALEKLAVKAGETKSGQDFKLVKGGLIVGKVLDAKGKPVPGMAVGVYGPAHPRSGAWVQVSTTDRDGAFRFRVPPGSQWVYLMGGPLTGDPPPNTGKDVEVAEGKEVTVDFRLP